MDDGSRRTASDPLLRRTLATLEHDYEDRIAPVIARALLGRGGTFLPTGEHADVERGLTALLGLFEDVLRSEQRGPRSDDDLAALVDDWVGSRLREPRYTSLRAYLPLSGYERLAGRLGVTSEAAVDALDLLAVYGSLRPGLENAHHLSDERRARHVGRATVAGSIHEVRPDDADDVDYPYPCLVTGVSGSVVVDVYEIVDARLWRELDALELFDPRRWSGNEYERRLVHLGDPEFDRHVLGAWVYTYTKAPPDPGALIASGDWSSFARARRPSP